MLFTLDPPALSPEVAAAMDPTEGAAFGCALAAIGDIDQDTVPDLLVGAFGQEKSGAAYVVSGKTHMLLRTLRAPQPQAGAGFGWSVGVVGDLTGDHIPELLVGAFAQEGNGRVFVFDGKDGHVVHTFVPPLGAKEGAFGWSVAGGGDLDHDGAPDILIGAPYTTVGQVPVQGRVYAFSGHTQKLLFAMDDPSPRRGEGFGWQVASGGDYNGDGIPDILVGAPYKDSDTSRAEGAAFVFNGADGSLLRAFAIRLMRVRTPVSVSRSRVTSTSITMAFLIFSSVHRIKRSTSSISRVKRSCSMAKTENCSPRLIIPFRIKDHRLVTVSSL